MRIVTLFLAFWLLVTCGAGHAQQGGRARKAASPVPARAGQATPEDGETSAHKALLLLQVEVGDTVRDATAFVVKSGPQALALTSFESVQGASRIHALIPGHGLVMAHLLKFAPEANLALLQLAVPDLPAVKLGDSDLVRPEESIVMLTASPQREGTLATAMTTLTRPGKIGTVLNRPGGTVLQLSFESPLPDESSGAPVVALNSDEVIGVALSRSSAGNDAARTAVPSSLAGAFGFDLAKNSGAAASVRVLEGSEAPVDGPGGSGGSGGSSWMGYVIAVLVGLGVVGAIAAVVLRRNDKVAPFSFLPRLPDGVNMAFVDASGRLLPMDSDSIRVGRAEDNDWSFNDYTVSNYHARVKKNTRGSGYEVEDLRSTNGTWVRGRRIGGAETIAPGTRVRFGRIEVMLMTRAQSSE